MGLPFIMVAPNGARRTKADHPALPMDLADTVNTAAACHTAGAEALHLHVRDDAGRHSLDSGRYREALAELAVTLPGMAVQITTEAAGQFSVDAQLACLREVRPGWASISVREIARDTELAERVYGLCAAQGTQVQHILYDRADAALLRNWLAAGIVRPSQRSVLMVLGRYGGAGGSDPADIAPRLADLPEGADWMVCAFGPSEHACLREAARLGGACRVGFETAIVDVNGRAWPDNAASVLALRQSLMQVAA